MSDKSLVTHYSSLSVDIGRMQNLGERTNRLSGNLSLKLILTT